MNFLSTEGLAKEYAQRRVVDGVSIHVSPGEIVGLLGPNGAGKTTTFNMVVGIVRPDEGGVLFEQEEITDLPMHERARARARSCMGKSVISSCSKSTPPSSGRTMPTTMLKVVVFPAPFGPSKPTISPGLT